MLDIESMLLGTAAGGGGNPNTVERISGTLANPWGDTDADKLWAAIRRPVFNATAYIEWDGSAIGLPSNSAPLIGVTTIDNRIDLSVCSVGSSVSGVYVSWKNGVLTDAKGVSGNNIVDVMQYAALIPTVLTIIHHPLP